MDLLLTVVRRIRATLRPIVARQRAEAELDEEMRFHLDAEVRERVRHGMPPDAALTSALRDFGGSARYKDECRDARGAFLPPRQRMLAGRGYSLA